MENDKKVVVEESSEPSYTDKYEKVKKDIGEIFEKEYGAETKDGFKYAAAPCKVIIKPIPMEITSNTAMPTAEGQKDSIEGIVLSVGPSNEDSDDDGDDLPCCQVGDRILYCKYSGDKITIDGKDIVVLDKKNVLARKIA